MRCVGLEAVSDVVWGLEAVSDVVWGLGAVSGVVRYRHVYIRFQQSRLGAGAHQPHTRAPAGQLGQPHDQRHHASVMGVAGRLKGGVGMNLYTIV